MLGGEHGRVARQLVVRLGAGLDLDDEQVVGLHEADGDDAAQACAAQLELVEAHGAVTAPVPVAPLVARVVAEPERAERQHEPREHRVVERRVQR